MPLTAKDEKRQIFLFDFFDSSLIFAHKISIRWLIASELSLGYVAIGQSNAMSSNSEYLRKSFISSDV
jgi:hypothetical protein